MFNHVYVSIVQQLTASPPSNIVRPNGQAYAVTAKGTGPQGHRAGVVVDVSLRTGGPVGHAPNPVALCDTQCGGKEIVKRPTSK